MKGVMDYRFTIIVEPCEEGGYFAECPSLPGCHVQGETFEKTLEEMRSAVTAYVEDCQKSGESIPDDAVTVTSLKVAV